MSGSRPPETNPPINPQYYEPGRFNISAISLGTSTTVTTSVDHNYVVGQVIRLLIPKNYGSIQLNNQQAVVTSVPADDQVVVDLYSIGANAFVAVPPTGSGLTPAQIIAIGNTNTGNLNASGRIASTSIPGSFINVSPN